MATEPTLGIGIPVYNGARYLRQTLECICAQTFGDFEVVVVDNASTDETPDIIREVAAADPRIRYVRNPTNIGPPRNFNAAFEQARGELFAWVAADDLHSADFLATCVANLRRRSDAIGAFTATQAMDSDGGLHEVIEEPVRWDDPDPAVRFVDLASFRHACMSLFAVFRRSAMARTQMTPVCWGGDRMLLAELALYGPMVIDPRPMFYNRQHSGRLSVRTSNQDRSAYFIANAPNRALTWYYARYLWHCIERADLAPRQRRRVRRALAGWAIENRRKLARSAARGAVSIGRDLVPNGVSTRR